MMMVMEHQVDEKVEDDTLDDVLEVEDDARMTS